MFLVMLCSLQPNQTVFVYGILTNVHDFANSKQHAAHSKLHVDMIASSSESAAVLPTCQQPLQLLICLLSISQHSDVAGIIAAHTTSRCCCRCCCCRRCPADTATTRSIPALAG
jgi:hypothetical protein